MLAMFSFQTNPGRKQVFGDSVSNSATIFQALGIMACEAGGQALKVHPSEALWRWRGGLLVLEEGHSVRAVLGI